MLPGDGLTSPAADTAAHARIFRRVPIAATVIAPLRRGAENIPTVEAVIIGFSLLDCRKSYTKVGDPRTDQGEDGGNDIRRLRVQTRIEQAARNPVVHTHEYKAEKQATEERDDCANLSFVLVKDLVLSVPCRHLCPLPQSTP